MLTLFACMNGKKNQFINNLHAFWHLLQYINSYRSATRCLLIPFGKPSPKAKISSHYKLNKCLPPVSGGIVYLIGLEKQFHEKGMQEMDESIIRHLSVVHMSVAIVEPL